MCCRCILANHLENCVSLMTSNATPVDIYRHFLFISKKQPQIFQHSYSYYIFARLFSTNISCQDTRAGLFHIILNLQTEQKRNDAKKVIYQKDFFNCWGIISIAQAILHSAICCLVQKKSVSNKRLGHRWYCRVQ